MERHDLINNLCKKTTELSKKIRGLEALFNQSEEFLNKKHVLLSTIANIAFDDETRSLDHGYTGLVEKVRGLASLKRFVDNTAKMQEREGAPDCDHRSIDEIGMFNSFNEIEWCAVCGAYRYVETQDDGKEKFCEWHFPRNAQRKGA